MLLISALFIFGKLVETYRKTAQHQKRFSGMGVPLGYKNFPSKI